MLMLNPIGSHVIHLFSIFSFLYLNSPPPLSHSQKIIKLFFSLLTHTYYYIFSNLLPFFLSLYISPLLSILLLHFIPLSYILTLLLPISFCINLISFSSSSPYFSPNKMWVLSLSLGGFLFFLIPLIKVDGSFFFFLILF